MRVWEYEVIYSADEFSCVQYLCICNFHHGESDHEICINTWTPRWQLLTAADVPARSAAVAAAGVRRCRPRGGISAAVLHCARQQGLGLELGRGGGGLAQIRWVEDTSCDPTHDPIEIWTLLSKDLENWGPLLMPCCVCRAVRGGAARLLCWPGCLLHLRPEEFSRARTQGSQKTGDWWVGQAGKQWIFYHTTLHLSKKCTKIKYQIVLFYRTIFLFHLCVPILSSSSESSVSVSSESSVIFEGRKPII